jgi:hypothetical protein
MNIYISRSATVNELHTIVCDHLKSLSNDKKEHFSGHHLKQLTRLWRFGSTDDYESLASAKLDKKYLPVEVHGMVLAPSDKIEDINVADDETIICEFRIVFDPDDESGWACKPLEKRRNKIRGFKSKLNEEMAAMEDEERM